MVLNVLVTGAARRIGAALARGFHARGCRVALVFRRSADEAAALAAELNDVRGGSAAAIGCATLDEAGVVAAAVAFFGEARLDVLVNNASHFCETPIDELRREQFEALWSANVAAPLFLTQAALPALRAAAAPLVINLVDVCTHLPRFVAYSASKAALLSVTRSLAAELAPHVRVNAISPGVMLWPEHVPDYDQAAALAAVPLARLGTEQPIVCAALYLLDAVYVTGQNLAVDGGLSLSKLQ